MQFTLKTRAARATAATLAGLMLAGSTAPAALAAPAIDRTQPAPTPTTQPDPFYTPPTTIPVGEPGDIIRARPAKAGPPEARELANAWQVMYLSTDAKGARNVVTGTILVPKKADLTKAPLVAFGPGTTGPAFRCTISRYINQGSFYEQAALNEMLKEGYAVAVTDYEGYHENPTASYVLQKPMASALLDVARAATRLPEAGLAAKPKLVLRGYSQGGGAAAAAAEAAPTYAPELDLQAVSAGGIPAYLGNVAVGLEGQPAFGFELAAVLGLSHAYPEIGLLDYYLDAPEGRPVMDNMNENDCTIELLTDYGGRTTETMTEISPFSNLDLLDRLTENEHGQKKINVPLFEFHANNDQIVDFNQARILKDTYCSLGVELQWKEYTTGHITTVARANSDVMAFIKDRLAGKPFTSNC